MAQPRVAPYSPPADGWLKGERERWAMKRMKKTITILFVLVVVGIALFFIAPAFHRDPGISRFRICQNNLRVIEIAKEMYALDHDLWTNNIIVINQLVTPEMLTTNYIRHGFVKLNCPDGGMYSPNGLLEKPTCSFSVKDKRHALPDH